MRQLSALDSRDSRILVLVVVLIFLHRTFSLPLRYFSHSLPSLSCHSFHSRSQTIGTIPIIPTTYRRLSKPPYPTGALSPTSCGPRGVRLVHGIPPAGHQRRGGPLEPRRCAPGPRGAGGSRVSSRAYLSGKHPQKGFRTPPVVKQVGGGWSRRSLHLPSFFVLCPP